MNSTLDDSSGCSMKDFDCFSMLLKIMSYNDDRLFVDSLNCRRCSLIYIIYIYIYYFSIKRCFKWVRDIK